MNILTMFSFPFMQRALIAGVLVILALVLPSTFWWFALGIILIAAGICICRR